MYNTFRNFLISQRDDNGGNIFTIDEEPGNGISFFLNNPRLYYIFEYDDADDTYFRIMLPGVYTEKITDTVRQIMSRVNTELKVCKCIEMNDTIWLSAECFFSSPLGMEPVFGRLIAQLIGMRDQLFQYINEINNNQGNA